MSTKWSFLSWSQSIRNCGSKCWFHRPQYLPGLLQQLCNVRIKQLSECFNKLFRRWSESTLGVSIHNLSRWAQVFVPIRQKVSCSAAWDWSKKMQLRLRLVPTRETRDAKSRIVQCRTELNAASWINPISLGGSSKVMHAVHVAVTRVDAMLAILNDMWRNVTWLPFGWSTG